MSAVEPGDPAGSVVDYAWLDCQAEALAARFRAASPYPHLVFDALLRPEIAQALEQEFPTAVDGFWTHYHHYNSSTLGLTRLDALPPLVRRVIEELNGPRFTDLLSRVTGFPSLLSDDLLEGGGLHMTERGGFLNLHADFTNHHYHRTWQRRCNLILFLNSDWQDAWGGALELWERDLSACGVKVPVRHNAAVLFETARDTFHGYPDRLTNPEGTVRKSLALYYYTKEARVVARSTNYRARPGESVVRRALIAADRTALRAYTAAKERLGLSDRMVSRVLKLFRR
jgi:hypothetical protein